MGYELRLIESAKRDLRRIPAQIAGRIDPRLRELADEPRPAGCKRLQGHTNLYRIRIGDYRAIYVIDDKRRIVFVMRVGHRGKVYRGLTVIESWARLETT